MTARRRVRFRTIGARQVWDGRKACGGSGFIPGIRHFQAGVKAYRAEAARGNEYAAARIGEIEAALGAFERSLDRWRRGLAGFASASLDGGNGARSKRGLAPERPAAAHPRARDPAPGRPDRRLRRRLRGHGGGHRRLPGGGHLEPAPGVDRGPPSPAAGADSAWLRRRAAANGGSGTRIGELRSGRERWRVRPDTGRPITPAIGIEARMGRDPACRGSVRSTRARPPKGDRPLPFKQVDWFGRNQDRYTNRHARNRRTTSPPGPGH